MFILQDINYEILETKAKDMKCIGIKIPNNKSKRYEVHWH
jgi:hypothetical protein